MSAMLDVVMDARSITTWVATQISSDERWVESGLVAQHLRPHLPICARTCAQHMRATHANAA